MSSLAWALTFLLKARGRRKKTGLLNQWLTFNSRGNSNLPDSRVSQLRNLLKLIDVTIGSYTKT